MSRIRFSTEIPSFSQLKEIRGNWTWQELLWGKCTGVLRAEDAIAYALERLDEGRADFAELLALATEAPNSWELDQRINALCALEEPESDEVMLMAWRRTILAWLYDHVTDKRLLQDRIECLYSDFGHPEDMAPMIAYMPQSVSYPLREWNIRERLKAYLERRGD